MKMIKSYTIKKIAVSSLALFLIFMFYLIPSKPNFEMEIIDNDISLSRNVVYLLDEDNYVSEVVSYFDNKSVLEEVKNRINVLIYGDDSLKNFYALIPKGTVVNKISIKEDNVYVDFNDKIKDINEYLEEEMIESIVYTLTEINGINNVYITIEGIKYDKMFNSNISIPYPLTRNYGINKEYDLFNLNNVSKTIIYFSKEYDGNKYYVPVTKISNLNSSKMDIIIEELKSSVNAQDNLMSMVSSNLELINFEEEDNKMNLVFNEYIFSDLNSENILEEVKYLISESVFANYDVNSVTFSTEKHNNIVNIEKNT